MLWSEPGIIVQYRLFILVRQEINYILNERFGREYFGELQIVGLVGYIEDLAFEVDQVLPKGIYVAAP